MRPSASALLLTWTLEHFEQLLQLPKVPERSLIDVLVAEKRSEKGTQALLVVLLIQKDN